MNAPIHNAIALLKSSDAQILGGVNMKMIEEAEHRLSVKLPESYKIFLEEIGFGMLSPFTFQGLVNRPNFLDLGFVKETLDARKRGLPIQYVMVFDDETGFQHLIDTSEKSATNESPIYSWNVHSIFKPNDIKKSHDSYGELLFETVNTVLETRKEME